MNLMLSVLSLFCLLASATAVQAEEPSRLDPARFEGEIRKFEEADAKAPPAKGQILLIGSSTIRGWNTAKAFPAPKWGVLNRGFGGSTIREVDHYAARILFPYEPRLVVLYAGDNDIGKFKMSQGEVLADFDEFYARFRGRLPETRLVFLAIKPSTQRVADWPDMAEVNAAIIDRARLDPLLDFCDIATPTLDASGAPRDELLKSDGLHYNEEGYQMLRTLLLPFLQSQ